MTRKTTTKHKTTTRKQRKAPSAQPVSKESGFSAFPRAIGRLARQHLFISCTIVICIVALAIWGILALHATPEVGFEVGMSVPNFTVQTIDGRNITPKDLRGSVAILGFWRPSQWDPATDWGGIYLAEQLQRIQRIWAAKNVKVLVIVPESDKAAIQKLIAEQGVALPLAVDTSGTTFADFGIVYDPTQVFIDPKGTIRAVLPGLFRDQKEIESIIAGIKSKQEIEITRPIISDVKVLRVTDKYAEVGFVTDKSAVAWVVASKATSNPGGTIPLATPLEKAATTNHSLTLANLESETVYSFRALASFDADGTSPALSKEYTFTTMPDTTPPTISQVKVADITDSNITITWSTDEPATTYAEYPIDQWPNKIVVADDQLTRDHNTTLKGLKPSTVYKIALKSKDSAGHEVTFTLDSVKTKAGLPGSEKVGMRAPDFALPTLDGVTVKLSDLKGKIVILNFWLTYCEACKDELPHIQDIYEKWPKDKLALLTIPLNEDAGVMRGFMLGRRLTFPVLIDAKGQADKLYEPPNFPTTYFIDSQGIIREVKVGRFDSAEEIEAILRSL